MARVVLADRKANVTQISTFLVSRKLFQNETIPELFQNKTSDLQMDGLQEQRPHQAPVLSATYRNLMLHWAQTY